MLTYVCTPYPNPKSETAILRFTAFLRITHTYTHAHTLLCSFILGCLRVCVCEAVENTHIQIHTYTHTYTYAYAYTYT